MSPRTGRPLKDKTKDNRIQIRLDDDTLKILDKCADELKTTRSDVVRQGISEVDKRIKKAKK